MSVTKRGQGFVLLCQHFYPEMISTGMHMTELATRLAELGWQITVYCAKPSWGEHVGSAEAVPQEMVWQGVKIRRVAALGDQQSGLVSRALFAITFMAAVCGALWRERLSLQRIMITTNPPMLGLVGALFSLLFKCPYLLVVYDIYPDIAIILGLVKQNSLIAKIWHWITGVSLRNAAKIVVIGRDMEAIIRKKLPAEHHQKIILIPNWSDERHVRPIARAENPFRKTHGLDDALLVQYAGRMGRTHNLEPLVEAAQLLADENVMFQFIGEGAKKAKLIEAAQAQQLKNVCFLPYQPMEVLPAMLSAADLSVVCLESHYTGLSVPSKAYGIIASGTPILGFLDPESEIGQMVTETGCGIVISDPTGSEVATAIRTLLANPQQITAMRAASRQAFLRQYTLSHAATAYHEALATI